jgi:hypothetical protein
MSSGPATVGCIGSPLKRKIQKRKSSNGRSARRNSCTTEHRDLEDLNGQDFSSFSGKRLFSSRTPTPVFTFPGHRHRATT